MSPLKKARLFTKKSYLRMNLFVQIKTPAKKPVSLLFLALIVQWSLLFVIATPAWDAGFYYAYARSIAFDGDLDIENDLILSYPTTSPDFAAKRFETERTSTGRIVNPFAIGASFFWSPWLMILRGVTWLGQIFGITTETVTGYEWLFTGGTAVLSMFYGWLAFWFAYRITRLETSHVSALVAALTLMFTTPLLYYQFREPLYSHATSAFITTVCVYIWYRLHNRLPTPLQAIILGGAIGLATLVRWQHLMYLALPVTSVTWWWLALPPQQRLRQWLQPAISLALVGAAALAVFSLQMAIWRLFYGSWITIPQGGSFLEWTAPFVAPTLFSTYRGLLPWMPVALFATVGLFILAKQRPRLAIPLLLLFCLEIYINGSARDWFGGGGFGPRRFTSELALFVIGYGVFYPALARRGIGVLGIVISLVLGVHQWILLRYALVERIGGHNLSMVPDFQWTDVSLVTFSRQLAVHLPSMIRQPLDFFVFPGSPLDTLLNYQIWPIPHLVTLIVTALFILLCWLLVRRILTWWGTRRVGEPALLLFLLALLIMANSWIFMRG